MAYKKPKDALDNIEVDIYDEDTTPEQMLERRLQIEKDYNNGIFNGLQIYKFGGDPPLRRKKIYLIYSISHERNQYYYNMNYEVIARQVGKKLTFTKFGFNFMKDYDTRKLWAEDSYIDENDIYLKEYKEKLLKMRKRLFFDKALRLKFKKLLAKMKEKLLKAKEEEEESEYSKLEKEVERMEMDERVERAIAKLKAREAQEKEEKAEKLRNKILRKNIYDSTRGVQ